MYKRQLHSCAGTDWSLLTGLSLDLINFDAYEHFPSLLVYGAVLDPVSYTHLDVYKRQLHRSGVTDALYPFYFVECVA